MKRKTIGLGSSKVDEENPYWISFSDLMAGLLIIFILATMMLILELTEIKAQVELEITELIKINKVRREILSDIEKDLLEQGIVVEIVDNDSVVRVPADQLHFEKAKDTIPTQYLNIVQAIGKSVYINSTKASRSQLIDTIFIEGHTDSQPMRSHKGGNWGLSTHRAIEVWEKWQQSPEFGDAIAKLLNRSGKPMFSVSGYAATRPYIENDNTIEKRQKNRRIDIRFTMMQPSIKKWSAIKNSIGF